MMSEKLPAACKIMTVACAIFILCIHPENTLLAQENDSGENSGNESAAKTQAPAEALVPIRSVRRPSNAPEILFDALQPRQEVEPSGRLIPLMGALSHPAPRVETTRAYWKLVCNLGLYHYALDEQATLHQLPALPVGNDSSRTTTASLASAKASAAARLEHAKLKVLAAQIKLGGMLQLGPEMLPLPSDVPHVGPYRTKFESVFANRSAPLEAQVINRTLPFRASEIDHRAQAVQAGEDALQSATESFGDGNRRLEDLLKTLQELSLQRRAFLASVQGYNNDIVRYAVAADPYASAETLTAMLIGPPKSVSPPSGNTSDKTSSESMRQVVSRPQWTSKRMQGHRFTSLKDISQAKQTQRLVLELFREMLQSSPLKWRSSNSQPPKEYSRSLEQCLNAVPQTERLQVLLSYWNLSELLLEYQIYQQDVVRAAMVANLILERSTESESAGNMLNVRAWRTASEGSLTDCRRRLEVAQVDLAKRIGLDLQTAQPLPVTAPHAGKYRTIAASELRKQYQDGQAILLAQQVTEHYSVLSSAALAVIAADEFWGTALAEFQQGTTSLPTLLDAGKRQSSDLLRLVRATADYNRVIAQYVDTVSNPGVSTDRMLASLVTKASHISNSP